CRIVACQTRIGSGSDSFVIIGAVVLFRSRRKKRRVEQLPLSSPSSRWRRSFGTIITSRIGDLIWRKGFLVMWSCSIWVIVSISTRNRTRRRERLLR
ncbi:unnamed protein product, partial [Musa textilis]